VERKAIRRMPARAPDFARTYFARSEARSAHPNAAFAAMPPRDESMTKRPEAVAGATPRNSVA
jgi:hypothetical protein